MIILEASPINSTSKKIVLSRPATVLLYMFALVFNIGQSVIGTFTSYFGAVIGNTKTDQGILTSVRYLTGGIVIFWGVLADKYGKRLFILFGVVSMLFSAIMMLYFVKTPMDLLLVVFFQVLIAQAFYPAWNAFLGEITDEAHRGSFFAKINSIGVFVAIFFLLMIGYLMDLAPALTKAERFQIPFSTATNTFFLALLLLLLFFQCMPREQTTKKASLDFKKDTLANIWRNQSFKRLIIVCVIYQFSMSILWPLIPFITLSVAKDSWLIISALWAVFNAPIAIFTVLGGKWSDKIGRKKVIILFRFLLFLVPVGYMIALITKDPIWLIITGIVGGIANGGSDMNITALSIDIAEKSDPHLMSTYNSLLLFVLGITAFTGSILAGFIADVLISIVNDETVVFLYMLVVIAITRIIAWVAHFWI